MSRRACHKCGAPEAERSGGGTTPYCRPHWDEFLATMRTTPFRDRHGRPVDGIGCRTNQPRPEIGPGVEVVKCCAPGCGAVWTGLPYEPCALCVERRRFGPVAEELEGAKRAAKVQILTAPSKAEFGDQWDQAMCEYAKRLQRAVSAGQVTVAEARANWRRAVIRNGS